MTKMATKTVLITGAATGVGLAATKLLSQKGYHILATAMPGQDTAELKRMCNLQIIEVDLSDESSIDKLIEVVHNQGKLHAIISNAGIAVPGPMECMPMELIKLQYQINVFAPIRLVQGLLPQLRETKGRMIFIGAGQGRVCLPFGGPYGSSKAALAAITDALRAEIHNSGIDISVIEPGAIKTGILETSKNRWASVLSGLSQTDLERYKSAMEKTFQTSERAFQSAMTSDEFAQDILKILECKSPKPRYLVGREAKALAIIAILPARWRVALLARLVK
jgi:NAD(P)-dependent dehydrogenase (short-subunit alcohol dehydrogenase family)